MKIIVFFNFFFSFVLSTFCNFNITFHHSQTFLKSSCNLQLNNSVYTIFIQNKRQLLQPYIPPENNTISLTEILYIIVGVSGLLNFILLISLIVICKKYNKLSKSGRIVKFPMECIFKENKDQNKFFENATTIKTIQI
jgi:hypothetical protein